MVRGGIGVGIGTGWDRSEDHESAQGKREVVIGASNLMYGSLRPSVPLVVVFLSEHCASHASILFYMSCFVMLILF